MTVNFKSLKVMKKSKEQNSKLSFEKFQISKIKNSNVIMGGNADDPITPSVRTRPTQVQ